MSAITLDELKKMIDPTWGLQNKIGIIKNIRAMTGEGLKEAKDFCEQIWWPMLEDMQQAFPSGYEPKAKPQYVEDESLIQRIEALERQMAELRRTNVTQVAQRIFDHQDGD